MIIFASLTTLGVAAIFIIADKTKISQNNTITEQEQTKYQFKQSTIPSDSIINTGKQVSLADNLFQKAIDEISDMLNDKQPLSFKRAVFLTENAYYNGQLDWIVFNNEFDRIKSILNKMIIAKNLQQYKTAGNWAIFSYMTDTIPENNLQPYTYDLDNYMGDKDYQCFTVSNLLKSKKGNCHSLPYMYKILANEVNVEAFLAIAPMHCYIRHKDEQGKWWNLELTTGTFSRTSFIIESFNISDEGMESGLYMKPLSEKESISLCLHDLIDYYDKQTGIYYGSLVRKAYTVGLKFYPNSLWQMVKANDEKYQLDSAMEANGIKDYNKIDLNPEIVKFDKKFKATKDYIAKIGYSKITPEQYKEKLHIVENEKQKRQKNN